MPVAEQIRLINGHTDIVSNAGSAAQNALFALYAPRLHLLTNEHLFSPDYFMHVEIAGTPTTFINCLGSAGRGVYPGAPKFTPLQLDVSLLVDYLDQRGLLRGRSRQNPAGRGSRLRARYDEAWLYGRVRAAAVNRETLAAEIETEADAVAATSWPVSLALARYCATRDGARAEALVQQFAALATQEQDASRLARHLQDVRELARTIARRCGAAANEAMIRVAADRFGVDLNVPTIDVDEDEDSRVESPEG
jgi:hypothetical protein